MKLGQNEAIVKDFIIRGSDCIGAIKTKTDVMISFTKLQEEFSYFVRIRQQKVKIGGKYFWKTIKID